jgi:hypothetical protein
MSLNLPPPLFLPVAGSPIWETSFGRWPACAIGHSICSSIHCIYCEKKNCSSSQEHDWPMVDLLFRSKQRCSSNRRHFILSKFIFDVLVIWINSCIEQEISSLRFLRRRRRKYLCFVKNLSLSIRQRWYWRKPQIHSVSWCKPCRFWCSWAVQPYITCLKIRWSSWCDKGGDGCKVCSGDHRILPCPSVPH